MTKHIDNLNIYTLLRIIRMASRKLYKIESEKMISGVCAEVADYFDIDPSIVRIVWALVGLTGGGIIAYFIATIILPDKSGLPP